MYYELNSFYKRDTSFVYNEEENPISWLMLRTGEKYNLASSLIYEVDKIDNYVNDYDILPTIGIPLVSKKFKDLFDFLEEKNQIQFFKSIIKDENGFSNSDFFALNILNITPCLDKNRSVFEIEIDDDEEYYTIKKAFIQPNSLEDFSIVRMKEDDAYIIVTEDFKKKCEDMNLNGFNFKEEGYSIYSDL